MRLRDIRIGIKVWCESAGGPRAALVLRGAEVYVLRVEADNTVEKVKVDTGIGLGTMVEVIGDVSDGDRVIVRGAERLQSGQSVAVIDSQLR